MSNNPPHLIDSSGSLTPTALIPFCAYQANMTLLGRTRQDLPFTVCDKFEPTVLDGQTCYALDITSAHKLSTKPGRRNGITILLDISRFMVEDPKKTEDEPDTTFTSLDMVPDIKIAKKSSFRIHLNTLASYNAYLPGSYALSGLTKNTGTKGFDALPDEIKKCRTEAKENCQLEWFTKEVQKRCGCVPWTLTTALTLEVKKL